MSNTLRLGPTGIKLLETCADRWQRLHDTPRSHSLLRLLVDNDLLEQRDGAYRTTSAGRLVLKMAAGLVVRVGW